MVSRLRETAMNRSSSTMADLNDLLSHTRWLHRLARGVLSNDAASADDVVQQTWLAVLEGPPRAQDERGQRAWLARVAHNVVRSTLRHAKRSREREQATARGEHLPSVDQAVERIALQRELFDAVMALEPPDRDVVVLRYFESLPPRAIARELGVSSNAVRTRLSRALRVLRARLDQRYGHDRPAFALALLGLARRASIGRYLPLG